MWADNRGSCRCQKSKHDSPLPPNVPPCHRLYTDCVTPAPIRFSVTCGGLTLVLVELRALLSWFDNSCPWNEVSELYTHCACICSIKSGYSFPLPILSRVSQVFWKHFWLTIPSILLKKFGTFSEIITKNLGHLTLRLLMSYIYGAHILDVSRSHTTTHHSR